MKAAIVKKTHEHAPFIHDLRRLAKQTDLNFSQNQLSWLDTITTFNMNARYDSYKNEFYKKCTFEYANEWIKNIKELTEWIKKKL